MLPVSPVAPSVKRPREESKIKQAYFIELFAGMGVLTEAVRRMGIHCEDPDEMWSGGTDFRERSQVEALKEKVALRAGQVRHLIIHLAPPCASYSRARDRSFKTRVRSSIYPEGLPGRQGQTKEPNRITKNAYKFAVWAADELGAMVSMENPRRSYLWDYVAREPQADSDYTDVHFSPCLHGATYQKPTKLRCWNWYPKRLEGVCSLKDGTFSCGRTQKEGHEVLEFTGKRTHTAAEYAPGVCKVWAEALCEATSVDVDPKLALDTVELVEQGRVKRHCSRGEEEDSRKAVREREDRESRAGMRNPADLEAGWPELWECMGRVRRVLEKARNKNEELKDLTDLCGEQPARRPVTEAVLHELRCDLADELGIARGEVEFHHPASTWRYRLIQGVQAEAADPDKHAAEWLETGAPMGLAAPIAPGGLFPRVVPAPERSLEELDAESRWDSNHPSFEETHGEDRPPGVELIEGYVEKGMGRIYRDAAAASEALGKTIHPAPMGNVTTLKNDRLKHRVIQDLKANKVNTAVTLTERQVLPRGVDHGLDMARLSCKLGRGQIMKVMVLDFKDAFMSIPLCDSEKPYNCAVMKEEILRKREALDNDEPEKGKCIVWNVLGFGGKPNPLVYSRVASFAMRTAQAMFQRKPTEGPRLRSQLYVDDPAVTASGSEEEVQLAFDLVLAWWLALGIPLAWAKGKVVAGKEEHDWIGVCYKVVRHGVAEMTLPTKYLESLLEVLYPFCNLKGRASLREAERMVGKASRVAQVVPAAKPFVSGLWVALTETKRDALREETRPGELV